MDDVVIAGLDATEDGLAAMEAGDLDITVFQNATKQGEDVVQSAVALADGEQVERSIWIPFKLITPENMTTTSPAGARRARLPTRAPLIFE